MRSLVGERAAVFPSREPELQQWALLVGLDLGGQHAGGGAPALADVAAGLEHQHAAAGAGQLPGTRGPDRAAPDHDNIL